MDEKSQAPAELKVNKKKKKVSRASVMWILISLAMILIGLLLFLVGDIDAIIELGFVIMIGGFISVPAAIIYALIAPKNMTKKDNLSFMAAIVIFLLMLVFVPYIIYSITEIHNPALTVIAPAFIIVSFAAAAITVIHIAPRETTTKRKLFCVVMFLIGILLLLMIPFGVLLFLMCLESYDPLMEAFSFIMPIGGFITTALILARLAPRESQGTLETNETAAKAKRKLPLIVRIVIGALLLFILPIVAYILHCVEFTLLEVIVIAVVIGIFIAVTIVLARTSSIPIKKLTSKGKLYWNATVTAGIFFILFVAVMTYPSEFEVTDDFSLIPIHALTVDKEIYIYDDGKMELEISSSTPDEVISARETAKSVVNGETDGKSWTIITDDSDNSTVYISASESTIKAATPKTPVPSNKDNTPDKENKVSTAKENTSDKENTDPVVVKASINKLPASYGKENAAAVVSKLIRENGYSKGKKDYSTAYSTYYIEAADCILYYPSQLSNLTVNEDNSLVIKDTRSNAVLNVHLTENNYSSMDELEGFIAASENNLILAYGPEWYSAEQRKNGKTTFSYTGLGNDYIVEAELTYDDQDTWVFDELSMHIKCKFIGKGIWVSNAKAPGYKNQTKAVYGSNFSRQLASYYDPAHKTILLYPELFSKKTEVNGTVEFTDPLTGASIYYHEEIMSYALKDIPLAYNYNDSYIDGEHRIRMSDMSGGRYAVASHTGGVTVMVEMTYPEKYAWVYDEFFRDLTIVTAYDEIHNTEMQTIEIPEYGALITIPIQFIQQSFYGGTVVFADALNGLEMHIVFSELSTEEEKTNLFSCFDCTAEDDDVMMGDSWLRWKNNSGFFYGARGLEMKALMKIEAPNAPLAYSSTLDMFKVEFVTEESRDVTIADEIELEAQVIEEEIEEELEKQQTEPDPEPDHSDPVDKAKIPNAKLIYNYGYEYAYVAMDAETWFSFDESDKTGETNCGSYMIGLIKQNDVKNIISVLSYNNYTIEDQSAGYLTEVVRQMDQILRTHYYEGKPVTSDLGEGIASVFETMCSVMSIQKPEYVDHTYDFFLPPKIEKPKNDPEDYFTGYYYEEDESEDEYYYLELLVDYLIEHKYDENSLKDDPQVKYYLEKLREFLLRDYYFGDYSDDDWWQYYLDMLLDFLIEDDYLKQSQKVKAVEEEDYDHYMIELREYLFEYYHLEIVMEDSEWEDTPPTQDPVLNEDALADENIGILKEFFLTDYFNTDIDMESDLLALYADMDNRYNEYEKSKALDKTDYARPHDHYYVGYILHNYLKELVIDESDYYLYDPGDFLVNYYETYYEDPEYYMYLRSVMRHLDLLFAYYEKYPEKLYTDVDDPESYKGGYYYDLYYNSDSWGDYDEYFDANFSDDFGNYYNNDMYDKYTYDMSQDYFDEYYDSEYYYK